MGQQQILLIVLSIILVGIAIIVGISMFKSYSITAHQDMLMIDIINLSSLAYQYRIRPSSLGGGNGSFENFDISESLKET